MSSPMMTSSPNKSIISKEISEEVETEDELGKKLAHYTLEGNWDEVRKIYRSKPKAHTITVNSSKDTALHVAVDLDEEEVVKDLVNYIVEHNTGALEIGNEHGDTPLHVAASRGFAKLCKCIMAERIELRTLKNKKGETPLFFAALNWHKEAFAYLHHTHESLPITFPELVRDHDGDTILHCAIRREHFDLAVIILHYFGELATLSNNKGLTPLKVLATRPLAFPSGIKFSWWKLILYHLWTY
nr:E3 ubiquitin-protein ligase MIB2-like [Arachis hypogaea]